MPRDILLLSPHRPNKAVLDFILALTGGLPHMDREGLYRIHIQTLPTPSDVIKIALKLWNCIYVYKQEGIHNAGIILEGELYENSSGVAETVQQKIQEWTNILSFPKR